MKLNKVEALIVGTLEEFGYLTFSEICEELRMAEVEAKPVMEKLLRADMVRKGSGNLFTLNPLMH